jgi:hypothetical protein
LILNLHEASTLGNNETQLSIPDVPQGHAQLSNILTSPEANLTDFLYTPHDLADERSSLNSSSSWFGVNPAKEPETAYFTIRNYNGDSSTPNGWPAESFVEMTQAKRLLVGLGTIDPALQEYNISADSGSIFSPTYLETVPTVNLGTNGVLNRGCFFDADVTTVSGVNNSWATTTLNSSTVFGLRSHLQAAKSLVNCGISPTLNTTLQGKTADENYKPYEQFVQRTIWAWAIGEPLHTVDPDADDRAASNRCAALSSADGYWRTENCGASYYCACRTSGLPYDWYISRTNTNYEKAGIACPDGTIFDVPRTALENRYLLHKWRTEIDDRDIDEGDGMLWVNFNDLDVRACWVIGQNATCPYQRGDDRTRVVVVPTVAAVVVFVLAVLTVLVKCASNRRRSRRRRRRGDDGWDYEGVPS